MSVLSARRELFCQEYVKDCNGAQAAVRAGYSALAGKELASRLLTNVNVRLRVLELQMEKAVVLRITAEKVAAEYAKMAFINASEFVDPKTGELLCDLSDLPENVSAAISELKQTDGGVWVKFYDKTKALDALARNLGMNNDKLKLQGHDGGPVGANFTIEFVD